MSDQGGKDPKKKRNALGRGLSALLDDKSSEIIGNTQRVNAPVAGTVVEVSVDAIEVNPYQPRTQFDLVALEELSKSILAQGIIQPITVRKLGGGKYQLISGERRLQASKMAGLQEIPAYVRSADDEQMLEMALIENIQRQDLNPMEIAFAYQRLVEELKLNLEDLGEKVGKNRATVNNYMRLLKLPPELQAGLRDGQISMGHARALITVDKPEVQTEIFKRIISEDLSVRMVEKLVRELPSHQFHKKPEDKKSSVAGRKNIFLDTLEKKMEEKFGNRVSLSQKENGKGEIRIPFENTDDLNRILEILGI